MLSNSLPSSKHLRSLLMYQKSTCKSQKFEDPPFEEEILSFIRDLGHTGEIKVLTDVNDNHMHQPWISFVAIINKCLSGKTTALESLRLSRAQILWGMYHNKHVDYVYLLWEDLVYQVKNKNSKKNNDMDDSMFTTTRVISKHQDTQIYGAILPQHLTNQAILESEAYKTYHTYATGEKIPKPKYVKNKDDPESSPKKKSAKASKGKRLKISTKVAKPAKKKQHATTSKAKGLNVLPAKSSNEENDDEANMSENDDDQNDDNADNEGDNDQDDDNEQTESDNDDDNFVHPKLSTFDEKERQDEEDNEEDWYNDEAYDEETQSDNDEKERMDEEETNEEEEVNELYRDVNVNLEGRDTAMTDALLANQSSSVSSGFISNMLNPNPDTSIDSILNLNTESTSLVDVPQQTLVSTPTIAPSTSLQNLLTFGSLFKFEDKVKALEDDFSKFKQTNLFAEASHRLRDEAQAENEDFINTLDENIRKIIKKQVKEQVKEQVSKILPKIKKLVNDKLKAEVLTHSSNEAKTSHAVAANLSELKLKKIIIDKIENNKSVDRSI
ncbi:hypothetical protein Tco_0831197 [Tanacetum coccineum]